MGEPATRLHLCMLGHWLRLRDRHQQPFRPGKTIAGDPDCAGHYCLNAGKRN